MISWSILFRNLRESSAKRVGAYDDPKGAGIRTSHWFWASAEKISSAADKKQTVDAEDNTDAVKGGMNPLEQAAQEVQDIILKTPQISGAALVNAMKAKGIAFVKVTEAREGGPGSGRTPGSGGRKDDDTAADVAAGKKAIRTADKKVADAKAKLDHAKAELAAHQDLHAKVADLSAKHADAKSRVALAKAAVDHHNANIAKLRDKLAASKARMKNLKPKTEADSSSAHSAALVAESRFTITTSRLRESASDDGIGPTRFKVILLQEGLGNMRDAFYYSKEALASAIPIFTGSKIYADHPSAMEEEIRPERSVRDVLGHFDNLAVEEGDGGVSILTGELQILPDKPYEWARALVRHAIDHAQKFPEKDFIGLSINASGDAESRSIEEMLKSAPDGAKPKLLEAKQSGIESVRIVTVIKSAVSCDLVTEAGAGGKIISTIK